MRNLRRGYGLGVALAILAPTMGACRNDGPALVLEFAHLPDKATELKVELSWENWLFAGDDLQEGPVPVLPLEDGRLSIGIDRPFLAGKNNRLRLGLSAPQPLPVAAVATAT